MCLQGNGGKLSGDNTDIKFTSECTISANQLHWSPSVNAKQVADITANGSNKFDVIIASDCLFFKEFHSDLLSTLDLLLNDDGVCIFLQPQRDGTMQRFIDLCNTYVRIPSASADAGVALSSCFCTEVIENYNPKVREGSLILPCCCFAIF